jgi:hypothetical protein
MSTASPRKRSIEIHLFAETPTKLDFNGSFSRGSGAHQTKRLTASMMLLIYINRKWHEIEVSTAGWRLMAAQR